MGSRLAQAYGEWIPDNRLEPDDDDDDDDDDDHHHQQQQQQQQQGKRSIIIYLSAFFGMQVRACNLSQKLRTLVEMQHCRYWCRVQRCQGASGKGILSEVPQHFRNALGHRQRKCAGAVAAAHDLLLQMVQDAPIQRTRAVHDSAERGEKKKRRRRRRRKHKQQHCSC